VQFHYASLKLKQQSTPGLGPQRSMPKDGSNSA
jgi:hypothetical protein